MTSQEEKELISQLQQDKQSALKAIFDTYHSWLCQVSYAIVSDEEEAKDVVQEVFIKLWRNRKRLEIHSSLPAYLKRAAVNTSLNVLEKQKVLKKAVSEKFDQKKSGNNEVEQKLFSEELSLLAENAIQALPPRTKTVFTLIRSEEMSYKEVAGTLNISLKAVEKEMMKALRLLRKALREYLPALGISILLRVMEL